MSFHQDRRGFLKEIASLGLLSLLGPSLEAEEKSAKENQKTLPRRPLGRTGMKTSLLGIGGWRLTAYGLEKKEALALVNRALDSGVNYLETADCYPSSEELLGEVMKTRRKDCILGTKVDQRDREGATRTIDRSLKRLQTEVIDLIQFHAVNSPEELDRILAPGGAYEAAVSAKKAGKVKHIGITGHSDPATLVRAVKTGLFETVMFPINYANTMKFEIRDLIQTAQEAKVGIIAMKVLGGGRGPLKNTVEMALRWALSHPVSVAVVGLGSLQELETALKICRSFKPYTPEEMKAMAAFRPLPEEEIRYWVAKHLQEYEPLIHSSA